MQVDGQRQCSESPTLPPRRRYHQHYHRQHGTSLIHSNIHSKHILRKFNIVAKHNCKDIPPAQEDTAHTLHTSRSYKPLSGRSHHLTERPVHLSPELLLLCSQFLHFLVQNLSSSETSVSWKQKCFSPETFKTDWPSWNKALSGSPMVQLAFPLQNILFRFLSKYFLHQSTLTRGPHFSPAPCSC